MLELTMKEIVAFMIVGLKDLIPYIVQAIPEVKFSGEWLADKMSNCIDDLTSAEFCVRDIVTDNQRFKYTCIYFTHCNLLFQFTSIYQSP